MVTVIAAAWWFLAPTQLGGKTGYVLVRGSSMQPQLEQGDLAITRARQSYDVDDVILFESDTLGGAHVLHRIVSVENGRFVTRGDNRTTDDPDRLTDQAVLGNLWLTIPAAGTWLNWLGQPLPLAAFLFVLVFCVLAGGREASKRRARPHVAPVHPAGDDREPAVRHAPPVTGSLLLAGAVAFALFSALAAASWTRSATAVEEVPSGYAHSGELTYSAEASRSAVYPAGTLDTGQAVFRTLVKRVTFAFDYRFSSTDRAAIRGGIGLDAVISDGKGWSRPIVLAPTQPFDGQQARVEGTLSLDRLEQVVARMRELTSTGESRFNVEITPRVYAAGYAGTTVIDAAFEPPLTFTYDGLALRLDTSSGDEAALLTPSLEGSTTRTVDTTVGVGPIALPTSDARTFAAVGLMASLLLVAGTALLLARRLVEGPANVLHSRYGGRIVDAQVVIPEGRWVSDVRDAESLGVIAEHYDRVILHAVEPGADVYVVDDGVAVYRYRAAATRVPSGSVSPAPGA